MFCLELGCWNANWIHRAIKSWNEDEIPMSIWNAIVMEQMPKMLVNAISIDFCCY